MRARLLPCLLAAAILAAGCTQTATSHPTTSPAPGAGGPNGGAAIAPPHGENATNGLRLSGSADRSGIYKDGTIRLDYTAKNEGAVATVHGACERPEAYSLRDANGTERPLDVPRAHCFGFTDNPFPAGATISFSTTWNGTYAEGDHLVQAPPGAYQFTATFTAWRDGQPVRVLLTMPLNVLSQMGQG
ncbi:MAG: hypothetical protein QOG31_1714 [Thermoplasmata archaeon]|jgi:hypothetical protein|nr:hypothetical protein [Thermoplasmata archaeon]